MQRYYSIRIISKGAVLHAHLLHHSQQLLLSQKPLDTLHQVLVGRTISRHHLTHLRNHLERVLSVHLPEESTLHLRKLETHEPTSELQHSFGLLQGLSSPRDVSQAE